MMRPSFKHWKWSEPNGRQMTTTKNRCLDQISMISIRKGVSNLVEICLGWLQERIAVTDVGDYVRLQESDARRYLNGKRRMLMKTLRWLKRLKTTTGWIVFSTLAQNSLEKTMLRYSFSIIRQVPRTILLCDGTTTLILSTLSLCFPFPSFLPSSPQLKQGHCEQGDTDMQVLRGCCAKCSNTKLDGCPRRVGR